MLKFQTCVKKIISGVAGLLSPRRHHHHHDGSSVKQSYNTNNKQSKMSDAGSQVKHLHKIQIGSPEPVKDASSPEASGEKNYIPRHVIEQVTLEINDDEKYLNTNMEMMMLVCKQLSKKARN
uniref:Uncharacterized protein n=1 Tax=Ditylenchus dipsaci TaxID=166011 RepID=A0A915DWR0_9BILA